MPRRDRQRVPLVWGEGIEKERGLMAASPTDFFDLRNVLLHEGSVMLREGFAASGAFDEVDRIVAGHAIRNETLGIIVGYNSATERVYVYRTSPDLTQVELLGEWVHDLPSGWGPETPRIIMCEVNGRIFMAHDQALVTRRAYTFYYDPITGDDVLNILRADFTGLTPGGESESVAGELDAVRFRGVVRHLVYLVGWGFGAANEPRPELVRISLPDDPTTFDPLHYKVAGDRQDAVLACGPSGTGPTGTVLNVWKRTETHAIPGTDRRSFGIQLVDPRHGIVSSRAWINLEGVAIAWSEEGPRLFSGLGASQSLELPLGLDGWEPDDLMEEGPAENAFCQYVPGERVGLFIFGRRVYALTARVQGRWRWSTWELGFDPYGPVTLYGTTEVQEAPVAIPRLISSDPAGTYADLVVGPDLLSNLRGNETLEVWLAQLVSGSGGTSSPSPGVITGYTDFSEFEPGAGLPVGMTSFGALDANTYASIQEDMDEGNYVQLLRTAFPWSSIGVKIDSFEEVFTGTGEILGRVRRTATANNQIEGAFAWSLNDTGATDQWYGSRFYRPSSGDMRWDMTAISNGGSTDGLPVPDRRDPTLNGYVGWFWLRIRLDTVDLGGGNTGYRVSAKWWTGDIEDEPAGWNVVENFDTTNQNTLDNFLEAGGIGVMQPSSADRGTRVAFLSFTTDVAFPPPTPDDAPSGDLEWIRARSVAVTLAASQTVRVTGLNAGTTYAVALRYRVGLQYSPGASNTDNPLTWPSISQGELTTTSDPPEILSAEWERTSDSVERITLEIVPVAGLEAQDITVWRRVGTSGAYTELATIAGSHVGTVEYVDEAISGETIYQYSVSTGTGAQGTPTRIWSGPATIPAMGYRSPFGAGYIVGFTPGNVALETELHDAYNNAGGVGAMALRATAAAAAVEVESGVLANVPMPEFTWPATLRHKATAFTVEDFGEFGPEFDVTTPGSE